MAPESVVRVRGLRVRYPRAERDAVDGIDLDVQRGEIVSLVGESGSGKSTTVAALLGLLPEGVTVSGSVEIEGIPVSAGSERALRRRLGGVVGYVPQDPGVSLDPVATIGSQVDEVFRLHGRLGRRAARQASVALLDRVGIDRADERHGQYPHELSGGMRQRVLIAIALAGAPRLIVADEPTSGLDVTVQRTVLDVLVSLARDEGVAVLLVTHDLGVARDRSQRLLVMQGGRIVEDGAAEEVFRAPRHPYTRRLLAAVPSLAHASLRSRAAVSDATVPPVLTAEGVRKDFRVRGIRGGAGRVVAVSEVSLVVHPGRTLGIVGESGSGKSTLARIIAGLETPTAGRVSLRGADGAGLSAGERRRRRRDVQYVYQNPYASLDPRFTVARVVAEPLVAFRVGDRLSRRARVSELLDLVGLPSGVGARTPVELSGGQRQRVALARALALNPSVLVLDEPVSALDVSVQDQVLRLLVSVQEELGLAMVFISHDLAVVRLVADEVLVIDRGSVVETGRVSEVFASPRSSYTRALLDAIPGHAPT